MMTFNSIFVRVKFLLTPPHFTDPDKTRQASVLYIIALTLFGTTILQTVLFIFTNPALRLETNLVIGVIQFGILVLIRQGFVRTTSFVVCMLIWLVIVLVAHSNSGLFNPILGGLFIVNFLAGLLINEYAILIFAGMSIASVLYLGEMANQGLLPQFSATVTLEQASADFLSGCIVTAIVGFLALRSTNQAIRETRRHHTALQEVNRRLEDDISERQRVEQALKESEGRFRQMAENIREVFWLVDMYEQKYLYVSPAYELIWDRPIEDIYTNRSSFIDTIHPEDHDKVLRNMAQFTGQYGGTYDSEYRIVRPDGTIRWIRTQFTPVRNERGETYRLAGISEDVTARKEADDALLETERLRAALAAEHELSELKNRLMRTISHEFRTPLAVIQSAIDLIDLYYDRMDVIKRSERINVIRSQIMRLSHMLNDISLAIYGAEHLRFNPNMIDLEAFCRELVDETQQTIGAKHVITFKSDGRVPKIFADELLLNRAISNLLYNAVKYSDEESEICLELTNKDDKDVILTVRDHGIGIPQEEQSHIFEPFYRASNTGKINGTGLGLRIVKDCITAHDGTVSFESTEGQGTIFTLQLPLRGEQAAAK